jgi:uncharacterized protein YoxC
VTGWPIVVIALSTAVMALAVLAVLVGTLGTFRHLAALAARLTRVLESLERDANPAIESVRRTADEASRVMQTVGDEVRGLSATSRQVRTRVERTAESLEDRFVEFDTLLDVLHDELEDTVLDVAALLRTTRRGTGLLRGVRRVFGRRR